MAARIITLRRRRAVVAGDDDERIVHLPHLVEPVEKASERLVHLDQRREHPVIVRGCALAHDIRQAFVVGRPGRSEEHTSELQSLMRISYAVFCLKKKKNKKT